MFNRHPIMVEALNKKLDSQADSFVVESPEESMEERIAGITALRVKVILRVQPNCTGINIWWWFQFIMFILYVYKVLENIELAKKNQKIDFESRKRKNVKSFAIHEGEEVMKANKRKEGRKGGRLEDNWLGPFVVKDISEKGVATLVDMSGTILSQKTNVSQLKPFRRRDTDKCGENMIFF